MLGLPVGYLCQGASALLHQALGAFSGLRGTRSSLQSHAHFQASLREMLQSLPATPSWNPKASGSSPQPQESPLPSHLRVQGAGGGGPDCWEEWPSPPASEPCQAWELQPPPQGPSPTDLKLPGGGCQRQKTGTTARGCGIKARGHKAGVSRGVGRDTPTACPEARRNEAPTQNRPSSGKFILGVCQRR